MNENRHICRAKRDPDGRWFEGYYVMLQGIDSPLHLIIDRTGQYIRIDPETVGECTGCLDVQGRLIFEGDIICEVIKTGRYFPQMVEMMKEMRDNDGTF